MRGALLAWYAVTRTPGTAELQLGILPHDMGIRTYPWVVETKWVVERTRQVFAWATTIRRGTGLADEALSG